MKSVGMKFCDCEIVSVFGGSSCRLGLGLGEVLTGWNSFLGHWRVLASGNLMFYDRVSCLGLSGVVHQNAWLGLVRMPWACTRRYLILSALLSSPLAQIRVGVDKNGVRLRRFL